ncbi:MAG: hypothetical protein ACRC92_24775 [Peptostreptococcaceae bacterium]
MKRLFMLILITCISFVLSFGEINYVYCNELIKEIPKTPGEKILYQYMYTDIEKLDKDIYLLSKNSLGVKHENSPKKINEYIKSIDSSLNEASSLLAKVRREYETYKDDIDVSNAILALGVVVADYRFGLNQLKKYLLSETLEEEYTSLDSYFKAIADAQKNLNFMKAYVPKD